MEFIFDFINGIVDSIKVIKSFQTIYNDSKLSVNIVNCLLLNIFLFLGSTVIYFRFLDPDSNDIYSMILKFLYQSMIILPIFLICNILSSLWIDEIYYQSLLIEENTTDIKVEGQNFLVVIANQIERLFIIIAFSVQNNVVSLIGAVLFSIIGYNVTYFIVFFNLTLLYSIYVFEYILMQKYIKDYVGILYFVEENLFYFSGYGFLTSLIITKLDNFLYSSAIYLIIFPFYLISSVSIIKERYEQYLISREEEVNPKKKKLFFLFFIKLLYENVFLTILAYFGKNKDNNRKVSKSSSKSLKNQ